MPDHVKTLLLEIGGMEITVPIDEARALYAELRELFGDPVHIHTPWITGPYTSDPIPGTVTGGDEVNQPPITWGGDSTTAPILGTP